MSASFTGEYSVVFFYEKIILSNE